MKIRFKLFLGFLSIVFLVMLVGYFSSNTSQKALQRSIEENTLTLAVETLDKIDRNIFNRIENFQSYSTDLIIQETLLESNQEFEGLVDLQSLINKRDKEWTSIPKDEITTFMKQIMSSKLSRELIELLAYYNSKYGYNLFGEVFVTNKYGANVAQSGKTTDYRQDDETWWQKAKRDGLSIRDVEFDESAGIYSTDIGIRIDDENGNFIGAMKVILNIVEVINIIKELKAGTNLNELKTTEYTLVTKEGNIIFSTKGSKRLTENTSLISEAISTNEGLTGTTVIKDDEQGGTLAVHAHSRGYKDFEGLGWIFIIEQNTENIFAPVSRLRRNILIISLAAAVFAIVLSFFISRSIAKPVIKLRNATKEIGKGFLDVRIDINSRDEIGQLSEAFNKMAEDLSVTTTSIKNLNREKVEREQSEERLKNSERKSRAYLENSPACTKIVDLDFNLQYMSAAGIKALKIEDVTKLYGKPYPFDFYPESFRNVMTKNLEKVKETGEIVTQEASVADIEGNELWFHSTLVPVNDDEGRIDYIIVVSLDTTKRKRMEEELVKMQKLESVGVLAGGIAHDFNNNLQSILSCVTLAKMYANPGDEVYEKLTDAERITLQAKGLSQQLLTFSRGGDPIRQTIFISKLIKDSANLAMSGSNVMCEFNIPDNLWPVEADKGQLSQIISNIIINANQSMTLGGTIKVKAGNYNLEAKGSLPLQEGKYVKITITDQGAGISHEHLQKIFDPYFTTKKKGSGLGLATCYSIIKKHDGHIDVESEVGVGTVFHIHLPASRLKTHKTHTPNKAEEVRPEHDGGNGASGSLKGKVLLMDDEPIIRLSIARHLERLNYEVDMAKNGTEAIDLYKKALGTGKSFDAVVMDLTIPGDMGGKEATEKLLELDPKTKVIVASGYVDDPIMAEFNKHGFKGVLTKPYEVDELDEMLQKVIMEK